MKAPSILSRSVLSLLPAAVLLLPVHSASADLLTWDFDPDEPGIQDGGGTSLPWTAAGGNWYNVTTDSANQVWDNAANHIAQFGNNTTGIRTVTVSGTINVGSINFLRVGGSSDYNLSGGAIQIAPGGVIGLAEGASSSGNFISISSALSGSDIQIRKTDGAGESFLELSGNNSGLSGTLTLAAPTGSVLVRANNANAFGSATVVVEAGSGVLLNVAGSTFTSAFRIAGTQNGARGAIRLDGVDMTVSGAITLTGNAAIGTNNINATLSGGILEDTAGLAFHKTGRGTLTLTKASTYTGSTTVGTLGSTATAGTLHLDFSAAEAPVQDLLYNGKTAGDLVLTGGRNMAELRITGRDGVANSQAFGNLSVTGATQLTVNSGTGGSVDVSVGSITQSSPDATLAITAPVSGAISTLAPDGFLGAWATFNSPSSSGWTQVIGGKLAAFTGDTVYANGTNIVSSATANLTVSATSTGDVTQAAGTTLLNTLSLTDATAARTVSVGAGNVLQFSAGGGIQVVNGAKDLVIGAPGNAGVVTAGTAAGDKLFLTNQSSTSTLVVNSAIQNNAGGTVDVVLNGTGTTVLRGNNTYTGATTVARGVLEIQSGNALGGTAGGTTVLDGAALHLSGGITIAAESIRVNGMGDGTGVLRNLSGDNTFTGLITLDAESRINSDSGTLTLDRTATGSVIAAAGFQLTFGGAGDIDVIDSITLNNGIALNKDGTGTLILRGNSSSSLSGTINVHAGTLRVGHANALGTTASSTAVFAGATLELENGVTTAAEPLTVSGTGVGDRGGLLVTSGTSTFAGTITSGSVNPRINAEAGATLNLTASTAVRSANNGNRTVTFGGGGTINVSGALADQGTGKLSIVKDGPGTMNIDGASNGMTGTIAVNDGTLNVRGVVAAPGSIQVTSAALNLDFSTAADGASNRLGTSSAVTLHGGVLSINGKNTAAASTNSQTLASLTLGTATTNAGHSRLVLTSGTNGTTNLTIGNLTRNQNAHTLDISLPASGGITVSGSTATAAKGLLVDSRSEAPNAYATVNGSSWAALSGGKIVSGDSVPDFYTASTASELAGNADIAEGITLTTLAADASIASLRFNQAQETTVAGATSQALAAGGILVTSAVGENDTTISVPKLRPAGTGGSADLVVIQNNVLGDLTISSVIENTGSPIAVTKAGPGTLILTGVSSFTGATRVTGGTLVLQGVNRLNGSSGVQLGGGTESAKLVLIGNQMFGNSQSALRISGSGTDNRVVGGTSSVSMLTLNPSGSQDFSAGFIGGTGTNENNLGLTWRPTTDTHVLKLGNANSYTGSTIIDRGIVEVGLLANVGLASSLGAGDGAGSEVIAIGGGAGTATLRYTGETDSTTNRPLTLASSNTFANPVAVIQNNGGGTLKFTSAFTNTGTNTATRTLRLTGTNTGDNEIVGISDGDSAITALEKQGAGRWELTGESVYSGPTRITEGALVVSGAIHDTSEVTVASGSTLYLTDVGEIEGGTLSLENGSILSLEIGATTASRIALSGSASLAGNINLSLALTGVPADNMSFTLIDGGELLIGFPGGARFVYDGLVLDEGTTFNITTAGFSKDFTISYAAGGGSDVVVKAVPEPATATMLLAMSGMALGLRRFRRRA